MDRVKQRGTAKLDGLTQTRLGRGLRAEYRGLMAAPIPDDQVHLLLALRHKERDADRHRCFAMEEPPDRS